MNFKALVKCGLVISVSVSLPVQLPAGTQVMPEPSLAD